MRVMMTMTMTTNCRRWWFIIKQERRCVMISRRIIVAPRTGQRGPKRNAVLSFSSSTPSEYITRESWCRPVADAMGNGDGLLKAMRWQLQTTKQKINSPLAACVTARCASAGRHAQDLANVPGDVAVDRCIIRYRQAAVEGA